MADGKTRIYSLPEITNVDSDMYIMLDSGAVGTRKYNLKTMYDRIDGVEDSRREALEAAYEASQAASQASNAAGAANTAASQAQSTVQSLVTSTQQTVDGLVDDVNDAIDAIGDISEQAVPLMSESTRGGAKLGHGLTVEDGALGIGEVTDATDAGPIVELTAKGWAEQASTTGKNLCDIGNATFATAGGYTFTRNGQTAHVSGTGNKTAGTTYNDSSDSGIVVPAGTYTASIVTTGTGNLDAIYLRVYKDEPYGTQIIGHTDSIYNGSKSFTLSEETTLFMSFSLKGSSLYGSNPTVNADVKLQLELGSTATPYEPYSGAAPSPSPSYPQEIRRCVGRNLLDVSLTAYPLPYTSNGITFSNNGDGGIRVSGTATANARLQLVDNSSNRLNLQRGQTYTLSAKSAGNVRLNCWKADSSDQYSTTSLTMALPSSGNWNFKLEVSSGVTVNEVVYLQLELGSTAHPYVPYGHVGVEVTKLDTPVGEQQKTEGSGTTNNTITTVGNSRYWFYAPIFKVEAGVPITLYGRLESSHSDAEVMVTIRVKNSPTDMAHGTILATIWGIGGVDVCLTVTPTTDYIGVYVYSNSTTNAYTYTEPNVATFTGGFCTTIPIPLPSRGWVAALPDGTADTLTLDGAGGYVWEMATGEYTVTGNEGTGQGIASIGDGWARASIRLLNGKPSALASAGSTIGYCTHAPYIWNPTLPTYHVGTSAEYVLFVEQGETALELTQSYAGASIIYPLATPTIESGYVDSMPTVPAHATISSADLTDLAVRCCADEGAAEIASAWGRRLANVEAELENVADRISYLMTRVS